MGFVAALDSDQKSSVSLGGREGGRAHHSRVCFRCSYDDFLSEKELNPKFRVRLLRQLTHRLIS